MKNNEILTASEVESLDEVTWSRICAECGSRLNIRIEKRSQKPKTIVFRTPPKMVYYGIVESKRAGSKNGVEGVYIELDIATVFIHSGEADYEEWNRAEVSNIIEFDDNGVYRIILIS